MPHRVPAFSRPGVSHRHPGGAARTGAERGPGAAYPGTGDARGNRQAARRGRGGPGPGGAPWRRKAAERPAVRWSRNWPRPARMYRSRCAAYRGRGRPQPGGDGAAPPAGIPRHPGYRPGLADIGGGGAVPGRAGGNATGRRHPPRLPPRPRTSPGTGPRAVPGRGWALAGCAAGSGNGLAGAAGGFYLFQSGTNVQEDEPASTEREAPVTEAKPTETVQASPTCVRVAGSLRPASRNCPLRPGARIARACPGGGTGVGAGGAPFLGPALRWWSRSPNGGAACHGIPDGQWPGIASFRRAATPPGPTRGLRHRRREVSFAEYDRFAEATGRRPAR
jgi:hypothetical protein